HWYVHHMAMGLPIGYSTWLSENTPVGGLYDELNYNVPIVQGVHMDLMGDPTLRMAYSFPPSDFVSLAAKQSGGGVKIDWNTATTAEGFYIYRANHWDDPYVRLNAIPVAAMTFTDLLPFSDSDYYEVRAVVKSGDSHGTYYTAGQASHSVAIGALAEVASTNEHNRSIRIASDGPFLTAIVNYDSQEPSRLAVYDISGREIRVLDPALRGIGEHDYTLDSRSWSSGVYFVRLLADTEPLITKFIVAH
ncbi:MAG: T9SS type A sorting domain-containing protein, partial [Candidatus Kapaibacterium sp.]